MLAALLAAPGRPASTAPAEWPEDLARPRATDAVSRVGGAQGKAYLVALSRLDPGPGRDAERAMRELRALAGGDSEVAGRARYALSWLDEQQGADERAEEGYVRLLVDEPDSAAGRRARVGLARVLLRRGRAGEAARWLQEAIEGDPALAGMAAPWRELALRALGRSRPGQSEAAPQRRPAPDKETIGLAATSRGVFFADGRGGRVRLLDAAGVEVDAWDLPGIEALGADADGRAFAAARGTIYRLDPGSLAVPRAGTAAFGALRALAADPAGRLWVLDRRGRRLGCIDAAGAEAELCLDADPARLAAIAWDGRRLIGIDERRRELVVLHERLADGRTTVGVRRLSPLPGAVPSCLAADGAGRVVWLDARRDKLVFLLPDGRADGERSVAHAAAAGLERLAFGPEGALHALDAAGGAWVRWP